MKTRFRTMILAALVGAVFTFWWLKTPPPTVGGQGSGLLAPWVKNRVYATVSSLDEIGFQRLTADNGDGWYNLSREPIQSFDYYRSQNPPRPEGARRDIVLQPIGPFTSQQKVLLGNLKEFCGAFFQLPVRIAQPIPLPTSGIRIKANNRINPSSDRQFHAEDLIGKVLVPRIPPDATAYLGVTMADLWVNDLSFVFGVGSTENRVGVYSLGRYFPASTRKITALQQQMGLRRSCQVLDHEMGHMLGLYHCVLYKCAMNGVNGLGDADATPLDYCPVCLRKMLWDTGADGTKRYRDLLAFYRHHGLKAEADLTTARLVNWQKVTAEESQKK